MDIEKKICLVPADFSTCSYVHESETAVNAQDKKGGEKDNRAIDAQLEVPLYRGMCVEDQLKL